MRVVFAVALSLALAACASLQGVGGQFSSVETMQLPREPGNFTEGVVAAGEALGYQYSGGNQNLNLVRLTDQPNFGESVLMGRSYGIVLTVRLLPDNRSVEINYTASGDRNAAAKKSQKRLTEFKNALRARFR